MISGTHYRDSLELSLTKKTSKKSSKSTTSKEVKRNIRIYEDLLDDISKDDVKQKDVKSLVAGLDTDSAYDPSDINPAEYEFMICYEIYHPDVDKAKVLFESLCEYMSDYLDANRGIQEHSCVMIYTIHEEYLVSDCVAMTTEGRDGQYAVASINFAFNPKFHNVKRILQFIYGVYKIGNWNHLTEENVLDCLRVNLKRGAGNKWMPTMTITGNACEILGLCLKGLGKNLIFRARKDMKKVYNFALYMYNGSSYDFTSQFIDITKIDHISGLISRAI